MKSPATTILATALASLSLALAPAYAETSGSTDGTEFSVEIVLKDLTDGEVGSIDNTNSKHHEIAPSEVKEVAEYIYFEEKREGDPRPRKQIGGGLKDGDYCQNDQGEVGVFRYLPHPVGDTDTSEFYELQNSPRLLGCVPFDPADLEAANLEAIEEDGSIVLRPIRVVLTVQDLASFPIAPASIHQQNPPHTLKNYHTNFWADPNPQEFTTTIAGRVVQVRATPVLYTFDYGDGEQKTTTNPGYRLAEDIWDEETPTSHQYKEAKDFTFTLTTTYRGEYSVEGGPWQVIDGTVEQTGEGQLVRVWQTKVGLVAGNR